MRKTHLQDTKHLGPACQGGRIGGSLRGEHITVKFPEFNATHQKLQCDRCYASKLFAFLARKYN